MADLHSVVCLKVVPKPEEIKVDPETRRLERETARSEINPPDMNALEMALGLKDLHGGMVSLLSMGPDFFEPYLRLGLAMGADQAFLLSDRRFAGADTLATTYTLAMAIKKIGWADLILCGEESSDGATGQVPPGLAEWLDLPQITLVSELQVDPDSGVVRGRRGLPGGHEVLEAPLPCVISVKTASNEPRFMDYDLKPWAFDQAQVRVWSCEDLKADEELIGIPGSPTIVAGLDQATERERKRQFLQGSVEDMARQLAALLEQAS